MPEFENVRAAFDLPKGYKYLSADLSQIEVAVLASLSKDPNMIKDVIDGIDFHSKILCSVTGRDYDSFMKELPVNNLLILERKKIKEVRFQLQYGASVPAICRTTGLTRKEVSDIIKAEDKEYPNVKIYHNELLKELEYNRRLSADGTMDVSFITLPTNRRIKFSKEVIKDKWYLPQVKNYPIQGTAAEILKVWLVCINRLFTNDWIIPVLTVHDDMLFKCKEERIDDGCKLIKQSARKIPVYLKNKFDIDWPVPIKGEIKIGATWGTMKHLDNF